MALTYSSFDIILNEMHFYFNVPAMIIQANPVTVY